MSYFNWSLTTYLSTYSLVFCLFLTHFCLLHLPPIFLNVRSDLSGRSFLSLITSAPMSFLSLSLSISRSLSLSLSLSLSHTSFLSLSLTLPFSLSLSHFLSLSLFLFLMHIQSTDDEGKTERAICHCVENTFPSCLLLLVVPISPFVSASSGHTHRQDFINSQKTLYATNYLNTWQFSRRKTTPRFYIKLGRIS